MSDGETWWEGEIDAGDATPAAAAELLEAVGQTLQEAPEDRRYDIDLTVSEREVTA